MSEVPRAAKLRSNISPHTCICLLLEYAYSAPGTALPLSATLTGVCDVVDLASPSIKRNLNICQGTIDDAFGLFQNITNATLIILENYSALSCKKHISLRDIRLHSPNLLLY